MAKQLSEWLDDFVKNGADPNDIDNWSKGSGGGSKIYTIQVTGSTDSRYPENYSFTTQVDSKDIKTCDDLLNYLIDKGYYFNWSSGEGSGFILQAVGKAGRNYTVTGIYTYSGEYVSLVNTSEDSYTLAPETTEITYLGE